jgi:hypothetical protein
MNWLFVYDIHRVDYQLFDKANYSMKTVGFHIYIDVVCPYMFHWFLSHANYA